MLAQVPIVLSIPCSKTNISYKMLHEKVQRPPLTNVGPMLSRDVMPNPQTQIAFARSSLHTRPTVAPISLEHHPEMGVLKDILKIYTDNGGDLRSVPIELIDGVLNIDLHITGRDYAIMYMLVRQKKNYNKESERVTSLRQWIETWERAPISSTASGTESETSVQAEMRVQQRKLWQRIAGLPRTRVKPEERERWRRIDRGSPSPEVDARERKR